MGYQHAMDWVSTLAGIAEVRLGNAQRFLAAHCKHGGGMEACVNKPFWVLTLQARIAADSVKFETLHGLWSAEFVNLQGLQADQAQARSELATDRQRLVDAKSALAVCEG